MALIIMCCYDTEENGRSEYTAQTLQSLEETVDWNRHRLVIVNNGSCEQTVNLLLLAITKGHTVITNSTNLGTAKAINQGLLLRKPGEFCVKCDNDVKFWTKDWVDEMDAVLLRCPEIGIVGLKRNDVEWDGKCISLPHKPGQRWITVEKGTYIMGTVTMFNHQLIDRIGGMKQAGVYGMDDTLYSLRSELSGFWNCYLPHINIDHIDTGHNGYTQVKHRQAGEAWPEYMKLHQSYISGERPLWEEFE